MYHLDRYFSILDACGGRRTELKRQDRWACEQRWRHTYAARLHAATGKWKWLDYDWHVFSYGHASARNDAAAIAEYLQLEAADLIVIPEQHSFPSLPACRLANARLSLFQGSGLDVIVSPEDFTWTMAFTHEEGSCGPCFCRREWVVPDAQ
jgi:hypothetical protein